MRKALCSLLLCLSLSIAASAQDASRVYIEPTGWSIGINLGKTDLWGDVGPQSLSTAWTNSQYFKHIACLGGMFGRYTIHPCFSLRFMVNYGSVYATDKANYDEAKNDNAKNSDAYLAYARDQTARSLIFENSLLMEFSPFRMNPESRSAHRRGQFYLAAGFSVLHFEPYSTVGASNTWVKTYDLHLEGEGWGSGYPPNYKKWTYSIPWGMGYRWDLGKHLNLGFEMLFHKTRTSYLDGMGESKYVDPAEYQKHLSPQEAALALQIDDKHYVLGLEPQAQPGTYRGMGPNGSTHYVDAYISYSITFYYKIFTATREWWH